MFLKFWACWDPWAGWHHAPSIFLYLQWTWNISHNSSEFLTPDHFQPKYHPSWILWYLLARPTLSEIHWADLAIPSESVFKNYFPNLSAWWRSGGDLKLIVRGLGAEKESMGAGKAKVAQGSSSWRINSLELEYK